MRQGSNVWPRNAPPDCSGYNNLISVQFRTPAEGHSGNCCNQAIAGSMSVKAIYQQLSSCETLTPYTETSFPRERVAHAEHSIWSRREFGWFHRRPEWRGGLDHSGPGG